MMLMKGGLTKDFEEFHLEGNQQLHYGKQEYQPRKLIENLSESLQQSI